MNPGKYPGLVVRVAGYCAYFDDLPDSDHVRKLIYEIDTRSLNECRHLFANSVNVSNRMKTYLDIDSEPLYHPPPLAGRYRCEEYGDFILSVGRLEVNKRVELLIRSLAQSRAPVKAIITGKGPQSDNLKALCAELGVADRVKFTGFVSDDELLALYARCGAVYYAPVDEDYGYITLEAFLSGKAVVTANDSGGVLEFVTNDRTGYISSPSPEAIAQNIDKWFHSEDRGRLLGKTGCELCREITWDNVINRLTAVLREDRKCQ